MPLTIVNAARLRQTQSHETLWDPRKLLEIADDSRCVGHAPSQGRKCRNIIAHDNARAADDLISSMSHMQPDPVALRSFLERIAQRLLCRRWHQDQRESMVRQWAERMASSEPAEEEDDAYAQLQTLVDRLGARREHSAQAKAALSDAAEMLQLMGGHDMASTGSRARTHYTVSTSGASASNVIRSGDGSQRSNVTLPGYRPSSTRPSASTPQPQSATSANVLPSRTFRSPSQSTAGSSTLSTSSPALSTARLPVVARSSPSSTPSPGAPRSRGLVSAAAPSPPQTTSRPRRPAIADAATYRIRTQAGTRPHPSRSAERLAPSTPPASPRGSPPSSSQCNTRHVRRRAIGDHCCICYEDYLQQDELAWCKATCGNSFHKGCIQRWSASGASGTVTCPMCRRAWGPECSCEH